MSNDPLEQGGPLMQFEYEYLKGDETAWAVKGAAWNIVSEYCDNKHYGTFGFPTDKGRKAMEEYESERSHMGVS